MSNDPKEAEALVTGFGVARGILRTMRGLVRGDGWENSLTKVGTSRDRTMHGSFVPGVKINVWQLAAMFRDSSLVRRIVREQPAETFRRGLIFKICDNKGQIIEDASRKLKADFSRLRLLSGLIQGATFGRLYGGALLVAGLDDGGKLNEPLNLKKLKAFRHFEIVDARYCHASKYYDEPGDEQTENYGKPKCYSLYAPTSGGRRGSLYAEVHESRVIRFDGAMTSVETRIENNGWDDSIIQALYDDLRRDSESWGNVSSMLSEASQGVLRMKGLIAMLTSPKGREAAAVRAEYFDLMKGIARTIMVDADTNEDYKREHIQFNGIPELLEQCGQRLCAATGYPATILFGRSPSGMNATGDSDFRIWYSRVKTDQNEIHAPQVDTLTTWLVAAKESRYGKSVTVETEFPSLWDMTDAEVAQAKKTQAETDKLRVDSDVYMPEEIALARADSDGIKIDRKAREAALREPDPKPDPTVPPGPDDEPDDDEPDDAPPA